MATTKSATYPYTVRTDAGVLVKGFATGEDSAVDTDRRNAAAKKLGITARYEATDVPCKKGKDTA